MAFETFGQGVITTLAVLVGIKFAVLAIKGYLKGDDNE